MSIRLAIAVPARDVMHTHTAFDLANAVGWHCTMFPDDTLIPLLSMGTLLVSQRNDLVRLAKQEEATHIIWIDSDMRFPPDLFSRLLKHDHNVVAANCPKRRMPVGPTAGNWNSETGRKIAVYTNEDSTGLEIVDMVGTGIMLCKMTVFDAISKPYFATPWVAAADNYQGEDVYFCKQLKKAGIDIHIDHEVSKEIGHIGSFEYKHNHTWAVREMDDHKKQLVEVAQ